MRLRLHPALLAIAMASLTASAGAQLPVNDEPLTAKWAPSEWGADDKVGAVNRTTPELVLKAVGLVKKGKSATLGKVYASDAPAFGTRSWKLAHSRPADRRPVRRPAARLQRRVRGHGAGSDRHAVRRPRPHRRHHVEGHVLLQRPLPARQGHRLDRTGSARGRACRAEGLRVPRRAARCGGAARRRAAGAEGEQRQRSGHRHRQGRARRWSSARASRRSAPATACSSTPATATSGIRGTGTSSTRPRRQSASPSSTPASRASASRPASTWPSARSS